MVPDISKKLDEISEKIKEPPKLSSEEKKNFTEIFTVLKGWLEDSLVVILEKNRDEAYRYMNLLIAGLKKVDLDYIAGVVPPEAKIEEDDPDKIIDPMQVLAPNEAKKPVVKPDLMELVSQLPPKERGMASRLDCCKSYEDGDNEATCTDCSLEKLIECVRIIDPTIDPAEDIIREVEEARRAATI